MLSDLSEAAQRHEERAEWAQYRNARYDTATYVREEEQWKRAGFLYVEVLIFDLQGVSSTPGVDGFHEAYQTSSPAVVKEVAEFTLRGKMGLNDLKTVYDRVAGQVWMDDFPRSTEEVWEDLRTAVWERRESIQLDEKLEAVGRNLLSEGDAKTFIDRKNEYEILRRVEHLVEQEPPDQIPPEKRDRAELYLSALNPEALGNRWKAKAYRRGGEVMLSRNGELRALEYFERALEVADRDEVAEVERLVKRLRSQVG